MSTTTEVVLLVDRSGSMSTIRTAMETAINEFITDQAKLPGSCNVTIVTFDSTSIDEVCVSRDVHLVPPFRLEPRGGTPLLDAIGQTITNAESRLNPANTGTLLDHGVPPKVLFIVITDGEENSSREFSKDQIKALVARVSTEHGWEFTYLGANVDAFAEASGSGIGALNTSSFAATTAGVQSMMAGVSLSTANFRSSGLYGSVVGVAGYTDAMRTSMGGAPLKGAFTSTNVVDASKDDDPTAP